jgi:oxygen-independent coproporphyrinogen-3 oxidase
MAIWYNPAMSHLLPALLGTLFPGANRSYAFKQQEVALPAEPGPLNLYIHLPFCRRLCPYCPYVKEVYHEGTAAAYGKALLTELERLHETWGVTLEVESVYFGGGSPSLTPEIIEKVMAFVGSHFQFKGEAGVEIHPLDALPGVLCSLKDCGITLASLGIQTFNPRLLALLRRGYGGETALEACGRVLAAGFESTDIDLLTALPGQSMEEAARDIETAVAAGFHQLSVYPLIPFEYVPLARSLAEAGLKMPSARTERKMLKAALNLTRSAGYRRTSIWSFNKPGSRRYTTVTRDSFMGIGAGAASRIGDLFYLNTFNTEEYIRRMAEGRSAATLSVRLTEADRMAYWLFWRCYDTHIDLEDFRGLFGREMPGQLRAMLTLSAALGITRRGGTSYRLSDTGAYLFHLVEKEYTHAYLEKMWQACLNHAVPREVVL